MNKIKKGFARLSPLRDISTFYTIQHTTSNETDEN
jgi:hypothetical protein